MRDTHGTGTTPFSLLHLFFPPCAWAWDVYSLFNENPLEMGGKGLWRGVGEPPLRGLYNVLASSSIGHHQFREEASTRSARIFGPAVSTSDLPKELGSSFLCVFFAIVVFLCVA